MEINAKINAKELLESLQSEESIEILKTKLDQEINTYTLSSLLHSAQDDNELVEFYLDNFNKANVEIDMTVDEINDEFFPRIRFVTSSILKKTHPFVIIHHTYHSKDKYDKLKKKFEKIKEKYLNIEFTEKDYTDIRRKLENYSRERYNSLSDILRGKNKDDDKLNFDLIARKLNLKRVEFIDFNRHLEKDDFDECDRSIKITLELNSNRFNNLTGIMYARLLIHGYNREKNYNPKKNNLFSYLKKQNSRDWYMFYFTLLDAEKFSILSEFIDGFKESLDVLNDNNSCIKHIKYVFDKSEPIKRYIHAIINS